jgi:hypothetical protein
MKAVIQLAYGPPDKVLTLREIDKPPVGENDVLVRVRAARWRQPFDAFRTETRSGESSSRLEFSGARALS